LSKAIEEGSAPSEDPSGEFHAITAKIETLREILSDLKPVLEPAGLSRPLIREERQ
jgi:hypothetical protein